jgi:hypothetical protein
LAANVLSEDGIVLSAYRYLDVSSEDVELPMGLGSRHVAAAAVSKRFDVVARRARVLRRRDRGGPERTNVNGPR